MRAMSVLRFVVLGAVGFGLVGVIPLPLNVLMGGQSGERRWGWP